MTRWRAASTAVAVCVALLVLGALLIAAAIAFAVASPDVRIETDSPQGLGEVLLFLAFPGSGFFAVGGVLALRRPENAVGWLCLAIGLLWLLLGAELSVSYWAAGTGRPTLAAWLGNGPGWVPAVGLMGTHLLLRLPTGQLPSPRWRWYSRFCTFAILVTFVVIGVGPSGGDTQATKNPAEVEALAALAPLFVLLPLSFVGSIWSLVVRFRHSAGVERLQLRWIAYGGLVCIGWYLVSLILQITLVTGGTGLNAVVSTLTLLAYTAIPIAIAIAVLRLRLYDIDVLINRTLVYLGLTATLGGTYLAGVLLLQLALSPLTASNSFAVAVSTLAVAALFQPARRRIQAGVDRRFFRSRYDAARTLARFGARAREDVELEHLAEELRAVVAETMQPEHVTLWLRGTPSR